MTDLGYLRDLVGGRRATKFVKALNEGTFQSIANRWIESGFLRKGDRDQFLRLAHKQGTLTNLTEGYGAKIRERTLPLTGNDSGKLEDVIVGLRLLPAVNGFVKTTPSLGLVVILNSGIVTTFQNTAYTVSALGPAVMGKHPNDTATPERLIEAIKAYALDLLSPGEKNLALLDRSGFADRARPSVGLQDMTLELMGYVLLHEYGHVVHNHVNRTTFLSYMDAALLSPNHQREYEADEYAVTRVFSGRSGLLAAQLAFSIGVYGDFWT